ncbi:MAG TPA: N-acetyltransferase [Acidobacteriota bacterium]|jgi:predicted acetylornithine/succinylornithine family transaminase
MTNEFSPEQLEQRYYLPVFKKAPFIPVRGEGVYLYEESGKRYLDFLAGIAVNALGYNHPELTRVIQDQATRTLHVSNLFFHPFSGPLARKLVRMSGLRRAFFTNSGTEAVEGAFKITRAYARGKNKPKIVALEHAFHGRTMGALSITYGEKYRKPFEPLLGQVQFIPANDIEALHASIDETTAAFIAEPILGEGGILPLTSDFLRDASDLCRRFDALFILDEIQCGLGRTGYPFYFQKLEVLPDILLLAKSLGLGIPLGAIIAGEKVEQTLQAGDHGTTFGGGPLACRAALTFLEILERDDLMLHAAQMGEYLCSRLAELQKEFSFIRQIRGAGLMIGIEIDADVPALVSQLLKEGIVANCTAGNVLRLLPPLVIRTEHVDEFLLGLRSVLGSIRGKPSSSVVSIGSTGAAIIRKARLSDVPAIEALINGYARDNLMLPRTRTQLCETLREFVVAEVDGGFAGCGSLHLYSLSAAELRSLAVGEKFLKKRLGGRIVQALIEEAVEYEVERIFTFTLVPDFFRKYGFRMVPHSALPEKVLSECAGCPKRECCNEVALVCEVNSALQSRQQIAT